MADIEDFCICGLLILKHVYTTVWFKSDRAKFPLDYIMELNEKESSVLRSKILTLEPKGGKGRHSKYNIKEYS